MILGQAAFERIDVVDGAVRRLQLLLDLHVAGDLREARHGFQSVGLTHLVVGADAVVAGAFDIASNQIQSVVSGAAVAKEKVANGADGQQIHGLGHAIGLGLEHHPDVRRYVAR